MYMYPLQQLMFSPQDLVRTPFTALPGHLWPSQVLLEDETSIWGAQQKEVL